MPVPVVVEVGSSGSPPSVLVIAVLVSAGASASLIVWDNRQRLNRSKIDIAMLQLVGQQSFPVGARSAALETSGRRRRSNLIGVFSGGCGYRWSD
jgi:hypothetical protein